MTYDRYLVLAGMEGKKAKKNTLTAYVFLTISAIFFVIFFTTIKELALFGTALLVDAAAFVYLIRAIGFMDPFLQTEKVKLFLAAPDKDTYYRLCAALEYKGKPVSYNKGQMELFEKAVTLKDRCKELSEADKAMLPELLKKYAVCKQK